MAVRKSVVTLPTYTSLDHAKASRVAGARATTNVELVNLLEQANAIAYTHSMYNNTTYTKWTAVANKTRKRIIKLMKREADRSIGYNFVKETATYE